MKTAILPNYFNIYLLYYFDRNNKKDFFSILKHYMDIGEEIKAWLIDWEKMDGFPKANLYVPANSEIFIQTAYNNKILTKEKIAAVDCEIIKYCNLLLVYGKYNDYESLSQDITIRTDAAVDAEVPIYIMPDLSLETINALRLAIKLVIS
jgi:hypothetical protein